MLFPGNCASCILQHAWGTFGTRLRCKLIQLTFQAHDSTTSTSSLQEEKADRSVLTLRNRYKRQAQARSTEEGTPWDFGAIRVATPIVHLIEDLCVTSHASSFALSAITCCSTKHQKDLFRSNCRPLIIMSTPTQGDAGGSGDKPPGLTRFMRRASKVLRKSSSKRESSSSAQEERSLVTSAAAGIPIPEQATRYVYSE